MVTSPADDVARGRDRREEKYGAWNNQSGSSKTGAATGERTIERTPREVKAQYFHRQQSEATFRLLKQEWGGGSGSGRHQQAHGAQLHLGYRRSSYPNKLPVRMDQLFMRCGRRYFCAPSHIIL